MGFAENEANPSPNMASGPEVGFHDIDPDPAPVRWAAGRPAPGQLTVSAFTAHKHVFCPNLRAMDSLPSLD